MRDSHHRVRGVEDVEEAAADGRGQDVVLVSTGPWTDPSEGQEHSQRRAHAEEVLNLQTKHTFWRMDVLQLHGASCTKVVFSLSSLA